MDDRWRAGQHSIILMGTEKTTRISEDLDVAQDVFLPTTGKLPINSLEDHDKISPEVLDEYSKHAGDPPDGGIKAWSVILG